MSGGVSGSEGRRGLGALQGHGGKRGQRSRGGERRSE